MFTDQIRIINSAWRIVDEIGKGSSDDYLRAGLHALGINADSSDRLVQQYGDAYFQLGEDGESLTALALFILAISKRIDIDVEVLAWS